MTDVLDRPVPVDPPGEPRRPTDAIDTRAVGVRAALGGAVAMVAGMAIDAVQHAVDPTLVEREGLFSLTNLGHALLLGGAGVVVAGLALAAVGPALYGPPAEVSPARRTARLLAPVALLALLAATAVWGSRSSLAEGHADASAAGDHGHATPAGPAGAAATGSGGHVHGDGPTVPLDATTQKELSAQLAATHDATMRYPTVADATAAGLRRIGTYAPGSGAHYMKDITSDFDPAAPTMWLYAGNEPTSPVVGVMFYHLNVTDPPEGYAGPNDHWHQHNGLCIKDGPNGVDLPLPVDQDATRDQCNAAGGRFMDATGWMIHVWSGPGWESPQGVFSHENPQLVCSDGKTAAEAQLHIGCKGMA